MFNFVKDYLAKEKNKKEYEQILIKFLADGKLDRKEKEELEKLKKDYDFSEEDLKGIKKKHISLFFKNISKDERITDEEKKELESLMDYFGLSVKDFDFNQGNFNKFYSLALIDKGILPTPQYTGFDLVLKKGEIVHWLCPSIFKKRRKITKTINYSGFTGSVKIMKGLRYRVGSINLSPQTSEVMVDEDSGNFWLTDQRIGFLGRRKNFNLPYNKILSFEAYKDAIIIYKDGRENPYIVGLEDVELPVAILSEILNR
jgi:hypothetical protein